MVPKLNKIMSLHGDNSNQVNPNEGTSIKRQRAVSKLHAKGTIVETKILIGIQGNVGQPDKAKAIANREMFSSKIQLIKSYDEQILDSINIDADMQREIFESNEFERTVSKLSINMWLKSHDDEVM